MARDFIHAQYEKQIPSNTFAYFVREALRRLWISKRISFAAVAMIAISLLIVGLFLLLAENLGRAVTQAEGKSRLSVYLDPKATPEQIHTMFWDSKGRQVPFYRASGRSRTPRVRRVDATTRVASPRPRRAPQGTAPVRTRSRASPRSGRCGA